MSELGKVCTHGSLERKCEICERDTELAALKKELEAFKAKGKEVADSFWAERIKHDEAMEAKDSRIIVLEMQLGIERKRERINTDMWISRLKEKEALIREAARIISLMMPPLPANSFKEWDSVHELLAKLQASVGK